MTSREQILARVKNNQPGYKPFPPEVTNVSGQINNIEDFSNVLVSIGGTVFEASGIEAVKQYIVENYKDQQRILSTLPELAEITWQGWEEQDPHSLESVDLAVIRAHFGVAENAALWITEDLMRQRVVPFICQQLAVVVSKSEILATMHDAYSRIGNAEYGFGTFIAGASKTADIEQSLVLGAHGPKSMVVFLI